MTGRCPTPDKTAFSSRRLALAAAKGISRDGGPMMRVYLCACRRFHLTSSELLPKQMRGVG